jgi:hypothetical protein
MWVVHGSIAALAYGIMQHVLGCLVVYFCLLLHATCVIYNVRAAFVPLHLSTAQFQRHDVASLAEPIGSAKRCNGYADFCQLNHLRTAGRASKLLSAGILT